MSSITADARYGLAELLRRHALLATLIATYAVIAYWLRISHDMTVAEGTVSVLLGHFAVKIPIMVFFVLFFRLLHLTYIDKAQDRFGVIRLEVLTFLTDRERMLGGCVGVILMSVMLISFSLIKTLVPVLNPFSWDVAFMELDRILHFGVLPHEILLPLLDGHYLLSFFTGIYNAWLFLMYFVLLIACFMRPGSVVRMQFLVAFVLTWAIGGNLFAVLFSSVGPVYYGSLGLGDTYEALMASLNAHAATGALTVVDTQALLWDLYTRTPSVNAISAFPSMHVGSSVLMAIFAFHCSRLAGIAATVFAVGIMIGSVLLAWHYAVDGYAGAVIAALCWMASGWMIRRTGMFTTEAR